jgi:poly-gamma-glutamate synthesis protein (capsule biosynthesis protein)
VSEQTTLVLAGDVMTGRGVDQVLAHPGSPELVEGYVNDARTYVELAERRNGPVPRPVDPAWPWGDALAIMAGAEGAVRVMNLETSVTRSDDRASGKAVHYRMSPDNLGVLTVAGVDVWTLANNHVLDHGHDGLAETLAVLEAAGLATAGAGLDEKAAWRPAVAPRGADDAGVVGVVVGAVAHASSGVPPGWAASGVHGGVALLPDLGDATADAVAGRLAEVGGPGDVRVLSVHWGSNWGYAVPEEQRRFAHRLVDGGVDVVQGHSSHHPRPAEVYRDRLVLYGCGDLVNDYEGISGYEEFRDDLRLLHLVRLDATGRLESLEMVPFRSSRLRLERASAADVRWLARALDEAGSAVGTCVETGPGGILRLCHG